MQCHYDLIDFDNLYIAGEKIGELTHTGGSGYVYDICIWNGMLVMTNGNFVNIYELRDN